MFNIGFVLQLLVMVRDAGVSGYMDFGSVKVTLIDVNDNGPVFYMVRSQATTIILASTIAIAIIKLTIFFSSQLVHFMFGKTKQKAVTSVLFEHLMQIQEKTRISLLL